MNNLYMTKPSARTGTTAFLDEIALRAAGTLVVSLPQSRLRGANSQGLVICMSETSIRSEQTWLLVRSRIRTSYRSRTVL